MFKACLALHRQVERLRKPVILGCWSCRLWISRRYCSFDPSRLSSFERHTDSQEQGFSSHSNPLSLYLQCVIWRPELFSFKKLGVLLAEHSDEVSSIPDEVFDAIEGRFPDLKKVLKRSHEFLGRAEYISFFSSIMGFLRKDMLQIFKKETNSKEQLDLILKYRREQGQLLDLPKFVRKRASVGNSLWDCSLLLSGYHIAASPCKNLKTAKSELYAKAVAQVFADFVKSIEKDFYSHQNKNNDGVLDKYLKSLIARKQPTKSDLNSITCLKTRLLKVIQKQYPNCSLQMFGSAVTGLWKPASDVDFVVLPNKTSQNTSCKTQKYLRVLTKILRSTGMFSVFLIGNAKVPIVKFVDNSSGLKGDISWGSNLGIVNSSLIKEYLDMNEQMKDFVWLVKEWVSSRQIVGAPRNYPSSYCWVLICLWFLQRVKKILPVISIPEDMSKRQQLDWIWEFRCRKEANSISCEYTLTQLLEHFFRYFAYEIPLDTVIFVSQNSLLMKRNERNNMKWRVEDPLESERDLMRHVSYAKFQVILYELLRAHRIISTDDDILSLFNAPKGESIRQRMTGCFDCLLEAELSNQVPLQGFK